MLANAGAALKPTGYQADLFNGVSLEGWRVLKGFSTLAEDDEGRVIIAAHNGLVAIPLYRKMPNGQQEPMKHYRLTLNAAFR